MKGMNNMYNPYQTYPSSYFLNPQRYMLNAYRMYPCPCMMNMPMYAPGFSNQNTDSRHIPFANNTKNNMNSNLKPNYPNSPINSNLKPDSLKPSKDDDSTQSKDYGPEPFAINIEEATKENNYYRTTLWTGKHYQLTLMSINPGDDIGLEIHPNVDQFLRIEEGQGVVKMGKSKKHLDFQMKVHDGFAIFVPAGTWHNVINTGKGAIKLYSIYAPPQHPHGTIHKTKADSQAAGD